MQKSLFRAKFLCFPGRCFEKARSPFIDVYIAKNSGRINWTSCVNLERFSYEVVQIAEHHVFHWMYDRKFDYVMRPVEKFRLDLFHQKGEQYRYILFDLA